MRYILIGVGLFLLIGCAQPTDLTEGQIENRIDSEERFDDEFNIE